MTKVNISAWTRSKVAFSFLTLIQKRRKSAPRIWFGLSVKVGIALNFFCWCRHWPKVSARRHQRRLLWSRLFIVAPTRKGKMTPTTTTTTTPTTPTTAQATATKVNFVDQFEANRGNKSPVEWRSKIKKLNWNFPSIFHLPYWWQLPVFWWLAQSTHDI